MFTPILALTSAITSAGFIALVGSSADWSNFLVTASAHFSAQATWFACIHLLTQKSKGHNHDNENSDNAHDRGL